MSRGKRRAEVEIAASEARGFDGVLRRAHGKIARFGSNASRTLGRSFSKASGALMQLSGFGAVGGFAIIGKQVIDFEGALTDVQVQAGKSKADVDELRSTINQVSLSTGVARDRVLGAVNALVNLQGEAGFSAAKMELLARASVAATAPMEDLAGVADALEESFGIDNVDDLEAALSAVITTGKQGKVPLNEMSLLLQQVSSDFKQFGVAGVQGAAQIAAAIQVGRKGFGTAGEIGTGLKAFIKALDQNAAKFREAGVEPFRELEDGTQVLRSFEEILIDIGNSELVKDRTALTKAFGSAEAAKFFRTLNEPKNRTVFLALARDAALAGDAIDKDFAEKQASAAGKMRTSINRMKLAIEETFTPERVEAFAEAVEVLAMVFGKALDKLSELSQGLGDFLIEYGGAEREVQARKEAPQLLDDQVRAFAEGGVLRQQRLNLQSRGVKDLRRGAAEQIVASARRAGLVTPDGKVRRDAAEEAFIRAGGEQVSSRDSKFTRRVKIRKTGADQAIRGLEEAVRLVVDVKVDERGLLNAQAQQAREARRR